MVDCGSPITDVAALPGWVVTLHSDGTLRRYDAVAGEQIGDTLTVTGTVRRGFCMGIRHDDRNVVLAVADGEVGLWDVDTWRPVDQPWTLPGTIWPLTAAVIDDRILMVTTDRRQVQVWDLATHGEVCPTIDPRPDEPSAGLGAPQIWSAALSEAAGSPLCFLGVSTRRSEVVVWDLRSGRIVDQASGAGALSLAVASIGDRLLVCADGSDGTLRISWWPHLRGETRTVQAHEGGIDALAIVELGDAPAIVSGGRDGALRRWTLTDFSVQPPGRDPIWVGQLAAATVDGSPVVIGRTSGGIWVVDAVTGEDLRLLPTDGALSVASMSTGEAALIAVADANGSVQVFDAGSGSLASTLVVAQPGRVTEIGSAHREGCVLLAVACDDGHLQVWDVASRRLRYRPVRCHDGEFFMRVGQIGDRSYVATIAPPGPNRGVIVCAGYAGAVAIWGLDGTVGELVDVASPVWDMQLVGHRRLVVGGPTGLLAIDLAEGLLAAGRPHVDLGIGPVDQARHDRSQRGQTSPAS